MKIKEIVATLIASGIAIGGVFVGSVLIGAGLDQTTATEGIPRIFTGFAVGMSVVFTAVAVFSSIKYRR